MSTRAAASALDPAGYKHASVCTGSFWEKHGRKGHANRNQLKNSPLMVDEGEDTPSPISQSFPNFLKSLRDVSCFKTVSGAHF